MKIVSHMTLGCAVVVTDSHSTSYVGHFTMDQLVRSATDSAPGIHIAPKEILRMIETAASPPQQTSTTSTTVSVSGAVRWDDTRDPPRLVFRSPVDVGLSHRIDVHVSIDCLPVRQVDGLPSADCRFLSEVLLRPLLQMNHALLQVLARMPGMNDSRWHRLIADASVATAFQSTSLVDSQPALSEPLRQFCTSIGAASPSTTNSPTMPSDAAAHCSGGGPLPPAPPPSADRVVLCDSRPVHGCSHRTYRHHTQRHSVYVASPEEVHRKRMREEEESAVAKKPDNEKQKLIRKALL